MLTPRIHAMNPIFQALAISFLTLSSASVAQQTPERSGEIDPISRTISESAELLPSVLQLDPLSGESERPVVTAMAISPDGTLMAAAGDDHAIRLIAIPEGKIVRVLTGHRDWVQFIEFSPKGNRIASCGNDGLLCIWNLSTSNSAAANLDSVRVEPVRNQLPHALFVLAFNHEDDLFAAGFHNSVYRLDVECNSLSVYLRSDCRDIRALALSHQHDQLAFAGRDGILRLAAIPANNMPANNMPAIGATSDKASSDNSRPINLASQPIHFDRIRGLCYSSDDKSIFSVSEDRRLIQFDVASRSVVSQLDLSAGKLLAIFPLDNDLIAVSGSDNTIRIINTNDSTVLSKLVGHDGSISVLRRTQSQLISGSFDTTIRTWNIAHAISKVDNAGRFMHPVAAQFEDSSAQESIR
jgi:WD40 repeat protein